MLFSIKVHGHCFMLRVLFLCSIEGISRSSHSVITRSAAYQAANVQLKIGDIDGVLTRVQCAANCVNNGMCLTAMYVQLQKRCSLFAEPSTIGSIIPSSIDSVVISFVAIAQNLLTTTNVSSVVGIWNTSAGGDSMPSSSGLGAGNYYTAQPPINALDGDVTSRYTSYGSGRYSYYSTESGLNTGLYWTTNSLKQPFLLTGFCLATAYNLLERDPMTITIEGSNAAYINLNQGSSWNLIYNGSSGLENYKSNSTWGTLKQVTASVQYSSFRVLVTSKRANGTSAQFCEIQFFGYY